MLRTNRTILFVSSSGIILIFLISSTTDATGDVFFSPSNTEGFPLVFLESMASGTPVVGANEGGTPLTFTNRRHGIHFPSHDQSAAVQAILDVLQNLGKMSIDCVPHARTFTWKKSMDDLQNFYFRVLNRSPKF